MEFEMFSTILMRVMENPNMEVSLSSKLKDDLGLCSFDMMILLGEIHAETGLKIRYEALNKEMTVNDLLDALV